MNKFTLILFLSIVFIGNTQAFSQNYTTDQFDYMVMENKSAKPMQIENLTVFKYNKDTSPDIEILINGYKPIFLNKLSESFEGERDGTPYKAIVMKASGGGIYILCGFENGDILMIEKDTQMEIMFMKKKL